MKLIKTAVVGFLFIGCSHKTVKTEDAAVKITESDTINKSNTATTDSQKIATKISDPRTVVTDTEEIIDATPTSPRKTTKRHTVENIGQVRTGFTLYTISSSGQTTNAARKIETTATIKTVSKSESHAMTFSILLWISVFILIAASVIKVIRPKW